MLYLSFAITLSLVLGSAALPAIAMPYPTRSLLSSSRGRHGSGVHAPSPIQVLEKRVERLGVNYNGKNLGDFATPLLDHAIAKPAVYSISEVHHDIFQPPPDISQESWDHAREAISNRIGRDPEFKEMMLTVPEGGRAIYYNEQAKKLLSWLATELEEQRIGTQDI